MTDNFDLIITADTDNGRAEFDLRDNNGAQPTCRTKEFKDSAFHWRVCLSLKVRISQ